MMFNGRALAIGVNNTEENKLFAAMIDIYLANPDVPITVLNMHGHGVNGQWMVLNTEGNNIPIVDLLNQAAQLEVEEHGDNVVVPVIAVACNGDGLPLPRLKNLRVLYRSGIVGGTDPKQNGTLTVS